MNVSQMNIKKFIHFQHFDVFDRYPNLEFKISMNIRDLRMAYNLYRVFISKEECI